MTDKEIINERFDRIEKLAVELAISKIDAQNKTISRLEKEIKRKDTEIERLQSMNQAKLDVTHDTIAELETERLVTVREFLQKLEQITSFSELNKLVEKLKEMTEDPNDLQKT